MRQLITTLVLSSFLNITLAQISFVDKTIETFGPIGFKGDGSAVTDINNDGLDDIAYLSIVENVIIHYQNGPNELFSKKTLGNVGFGSKWGTCIADLDNNGSNEIFHGGFYKPSKIITTSNIDGDTSIYGILPNSELVFFQGANVVDINNDGHLDVFACHDEGANYIWENDGSGQFIVNTDWIDFSINGDISEDASGNYGSIWSDIDFDGDIDLYIAKCRAGVTDTADLRRINTLYINNGDGTFTEKAEEAGLAIGWQSWTADFQDINNDGLFDLFLTNHDHPSQLLLNEGNGSFTEINNTGIDVEGKVFQGVMRDFDNDGWVDIFTAGFSGHKLYFNNRDNTFTEINKEFSADTITTYTLGDLNNDGYIDIFAGYASIDDKIWMNSAESENNYFAARLEGRISNKSAIGARVEIYGDWGMQVREVRSGESYGIMNSMTQYFGLGTSDAIDSLIIRWPSGIIQTEYNLTINSKILFKEKCTFDAPDLNIKEDLVLCLGDSITLTPEGNYAAYEWNDGSIGPEIVATTAGVYNVMVVDNIGCTATSPTINIQFESAPTPSIEIIGGDIICEGEEVILITTHQNDVENQMWSNGIQVDSLVVNEAGIYTYIQENVCGSFTSNEIEITVFESDLNPSIELIGDDIICDGDEVILFTTHQTNAENQMWSTGFQGDTLVVNESGEYTYTQEDMCGSFSSNQISITVLDVPLPPTTMNDTILKGEVAILRAEGTDISWYADDIFEQVLATGNEYEIQNLEESTSYYATQSNGDGLCISERTQTFAIVEEGVSTLEIDIEQVFTISPNPVNEILNLKLNEDIDLPVTVEIFDSNSRLIRQNTMDKLETSFDVSDFGKGIYIISIKTKGSVFAQNLVIY